MRDITSKKREREDRNILCKEKLDLSGMVFTNIFYVALRFRVAHEKQLQ